MRREFDSPYPHKKKAMSHNLFKNIDIPEYVERTINLLENAGFEAYLVGGCVRDLILHKIPKDWDITTNATPEQIVATFPKTVYENAFGTVAVVWEYEEEQEDKKPDIVEITPFRTEGKYTDNRHPDSVVFTQDIVEDLKRRDFTINAMAYRSKTDKLIDLFDGIKDIKDKIVRAVGNPDERFQEDALRMLRAIRFSTVLNFTIAQETLEAVFHNHDLLKHVSKERIRDEFVKIIETANPSLGIVLLEKTQLLAHIIPELREGIGCEQGGAHKYPVFEHLLGALDHAAKKGFSIELRLAALFHDIGKPRTRRPGVKKAYTFYGHEVVGAHMTKKILERLRFKKDMSELIVQLVRSHMFFSDTEQITLSAVRRIITNVGKEHIWELMDIRECDRVGMNKTEAPYRLRKYHAMIEECLRDPISVKQLAIDGSYLMNTLGVQAGPRMGWILNALLEEVLDDPNKNTVEILSTRVKELELLDNSVLKALGEKGKEKKEEAEQEEVGKLHQKHRVKK